MTTQPKPFDSYKHGEILTSRQAYLLFDEARQRRDDIGFEHFLDSANGQVVVWTVLHLIVQAGRKAR